MNSAPLPSVPRFRILKTLVSRIRPILGIRLIASAFVLSSLAKGFAGAVALALLLADSRWHPEITPQMYHLVAILGCGLGSCFLLTRRSERWWYSAVVLGCAAAACAKGPLSIIGWRWWSGFYVEGFASFGLWMLVLVNPQPLARGVWRQLSLAAAGFSAVAGLFTLFHQVEFLPIPRMWAAYSHQVWDLTIPLGLIALLILLIRSIALWDDVGLAYVVGLGPMLVQLTLEGVIPRYETWSSIRANRDLLSGFVVAALVTLPAWLVVQAIAESRRAGRSEG